MRKGIKMKPGVIFIMVNSINMIPLPDRVLVIGRLHSFEYFENQAFSCIRV